MPVLKPKPTSSRSACFVGRYAKVVEHLSSTLRGAVDAGELKSDIDQVAVAQELAAVTDGLQLQWVLDPRGFELGGRLRVYADRLLRAFSVTGAGLPAEV